jgi:hypothetical protein
MKIAFRLTLLLAAAVLPAGAAGTVEGSWTSNYVSGVAFKTIGGVEFTFHVDGSRLTGMASVGMGWPGPAPISEGKIDGDRVDFMVYGQFGSTSGYPEMHFVGAVNGDKLQISMLRFLHGEHDGDSVIVFEGRRTNVGQVNIPHAIGTFVSGRYYNDLTGTEFTPPQGWMLFGPGRSSNGGEQIGLHQMDLRNTGPHLRVQALVWLKPQPLAPEKIAAALDSEMDAKPKQRANLTGYRTLPTTLEHRTVSGQPVVSVQAEYFENGVLMTEYSTWIISEKTHVYIYARTEAANFETVKPEVEAFLATFEVP